MKNNNWSIFVIEAIPPKLNGLGISCWFEKAPCIS